MMITHGSHVMRIRRQGGRSRWPSGLTSNRQVAVAIGFVLITLLFLLALASPQPAYGEDSECKIAVLIGSNFDLSAERTLQRLAPVAAYNSVNNEFLVVWFDTRNPGDNDIFAQRVSPAGALLDGNIAIFEGMGAQIESIRIAWQRLERIPCDLEDPTRWARHAVLQ